VFSRFGNLELSSFVLLVSIFGGLAMFGGWGLLVGPLFVRLAKEALVLARLDRARERRAEVAAMAPPAEQS
jgi:predicted PurR-regulated permease PerM